MLPSVLPQRITGDFSIRFLVYSNSSNMVSIMRDLLGGLGYRNVDDAQESEIALNKLKTGAYDFVLSDWDLPRMQAVGLLQTMRSIPGLSHLPFLMFTAERRPGHITLAMKAGANGVLTWPWTETSLNRKLCEVFAKMGQ